jgi:ribose transport system substrate-binding protein
MVGIGCDTRPSVTIAVIPRTSGTGLWEPEHRGAEEAAINRGAHVYWNAPTREDDIQAQIQLVGQIIDRHYQGLVLAPDQALALITPVRRVLAHGIPIVVVGSPLPIPGGGSLSYILNDEETGGRIAAQRIAALLHGRGTVALLGINPDVAGIMTRARSLELCLSQNAPGIRVIKKLGSFNVFHEQQIAEELMKANPDTDIIVGLMWSSTRGAISATEGNAASRAVKIIGFDPDGAIPFGVPSLDSAIMEDTRSMGQKAVELIDAEIHGHPVPSMIKLQPTLITRINVGTPAIRELLSMDWRPGHWDWVTTP